MAFTLSGLALAGSGGVDLPWLPRLATAGELWGIGFLAPGGSQVRHAAARPAVIPAAWHQEFS